MKLFSLILFALPDGKILKSGYELSTFGWLTYSSVKQILTFVSKEAAIRCHKTVQKNYVMVKEKEYICHVLLKNEEAIVLVSDDEYPTLAAYSVLGKVWDMLDHTNGISVAGSVEFGALLKKYDDPNEANKLYKIQIELQETRTILIKTIDQLLEKGEKLDSIINKTDELSLQSKLLLDSAANLNKCHCILF